MAFFNFAAGGGSGLSFGAGVGRLGAGFSLGQNVQNIKGRFIGQQTGTNLPFIANLRQRSMSVNGPFSASRPGVLTRFNMGQREITVDVPTVLTVGTNNSAPAPIQTGTGIEIVQQ